MTDTVLSCILHDKPEEEVFLSKKHPVVFFSQHKEGSMKPVVKTIKLILLVVILGLIVMLGFSFGKYFLPM